jgi:hypothetical protein
MSASIACLNEDDIEVIVSIGFQRHEAESALRAHGNHLERAIESLVHGLVSEDASESKLPPPAPPSPPSPSSTLQAVMAMGFDQATARRALDAQHNNIAAAINHLLDAAPGPALPSHHPDAVYYGDRVCLRVASASGFTHHFLLSHPTKPSVTSALPEDGMRFYSFWSSTMA